MERNPFKFGTVVDGEFFTDRKEEIRRISSYLQGENHLIMISPRRYGKTSLIKKVLNESGRKYLYLDLQLVFSTEDFASQLLKRIYNLFTLQKIKGFLKTFRIIPSLIMNPVTGETEISFRSGSNGHVPLEDVFNLVEKLGTEKNKLIVVLDEFQEIFRLEKDLDRFLRSLMQNHKNINYIMMGSSESMIRDIFEKKRSPFYRFGTLMTLDKIPASEFNEFMEGKFKSVIDNPGRVTAGIFRITDYHPFYSQQLAFTVWEMIHHLGYPDEIELQAAEEIIQSHDNDYERLWNSLNRTDKSLLAGMCSSDLSPLSDAFLKEYGLGATSTVFSAIKRMTEKGFLVKTRQEYKIDDPFFRLWIINRRKA